LNLQNIPSLKHIIRLDDVISPGMLNFHPDLLPYSSSTEISPDEAHESLQLQKIIPSLHPDDAINIQFTSGTTGRPKGATLTHHNILNNGFFVGEGIGLQQHDKVCIPVPLYHCFGMVMGNLACVTHGATMVYPSSSFDPIETLNAISHEKCTLLYGVPTMFISQLEHPEFHSFDVSSLRGGITAGSLCPSSLMNQLIHKMNLKEITNCYGMTETSPVCTQTLRNDSFEKKIATVGVVHPNVEIQIMKPMNEHNDEDDETSRGDVITKEGFYVAPRGTTGELWVRGYSVMKGYWNDVKKTEESITSDGWMKTGDLASMTDDGYVIIEGRLKDMIIRGGENIYPKEIEEFLYHHPLIQDVQVVGIPDAKFGEEVCVWIILKENANLTIETATDHHSTTRTFHQITEDDIRLYCKGKIAHYKIPKYIRFVKSFPLTVSGKVRKIEIRETMIKELGLNEKKDSLA
jgi:fatty-acyl-CoA synthase